MTRFAPYLTLGAVALLGGGLLAGNVVGAPAAPVPAVAAAASGQAGAPVPDAATGTGAAEPAGGAEGRAPGPVLYSGVTDGGGMTVAIAVTGGDALAWVCGEGVEVWLRGTASPDGDLDLVSASGRTTLTGTARDGAVVSDGVERAFTAQALDPADVAGAAAAGRPDLLDVAGRAGLDLP